MPLLTMITFAELTKQVHLINDMILSDMTCENENSSDDSVNFSRHLLSTKHWYSRISWPNKKRYLLALLDDVRSAWTLSLLLKSTWNCRPKDAVLSASEPEIWSSYDQVPTDHNRTAQPVPALAQVMKNDRVWFLELEPDLQALVLAELLTVAGGPVMWEVYRRADAAYQRYRDEQLQNLEECIVLEPPAAAPTPTPDKSKKDSPPQRRKSSGGVGAASSDWVKPPPPPGQAQKELETNLAIWNATIKSKRDSVKLEEIEMTFNNGTKQKIWKVNRPRPEVVETVDFVQLLPSAVGKRILSYLPRAQLADYARVNKYWAFLVDDFRAELAARQKINADLDKLQELMLRHDTSMDVIAQIDFQNVAPSSQGIVSAAPSGRLRQFQPSVRASERSAGAVSFRHMLDGRMTKPTVASKPIRKLSELTNRLERRGAVDENVWLWCENVNKQVKRTEKQKETDYQEGLLPLGNVHFPCPLMKLKLDVPLKTPLSKDPTAVKSANTRREISNATLLNVQKHPSIKRYSLWTRDFSKLYPVFKIPSHQSPV